MERHCAIEVEIIAGNHTAVRTMDIRTDSVGTEISGLGTELAAPR